VSFTFIVKMNVVTSFENQKVKDWEKAPHYHNHRAKLARSGMWLKMFEHIAILGL
jgi:hypothetical protein